MPASFTFKLPDGDPRPPATASLDKTWYEVTLGVQDTHDPYWIISVSPDRQVWLGYMGHDRRLWFSRVKSEYKNSAIWSVFEHRGPAPPGFSGDPSNDLPEVGDGGHLGYIDVNDQLMYLEIAFATVNGEGESNGVNPDLIIKPK